MKKVFDVVSGDEYRTSIRSRLLLIIVAIICLILGISCLIAQYYLFFSEHLNKRTYIGLLLYGGFVMTVIGFLGIPVSIYMALHPERLIVGEDRYQIVRGTSKVTENVPFILIADLALTDITVDMGFKVTTKGIGIRLHSPNADSVLLANTNEQQTSGYHSTILGEFMQPLETIHENLSSRWNASKQRGTSPY